jgi:hypothetical protein
MTVAVGGDLQVLQQVVLGHAAARARICAVAGRNLTRAEWARYVPDVSYRRLCSQWPVLAR